MCIRDRLKAVVDTCFSSRSVTVAVKRASNEMFSPAVAPKWLRRIDVYKRQILLLSFVFFTFSITDLLKGNGYLAVYIAGMMAVSYTHL